MNLQPAEITTDFECSNAEDVRRLGPAEFSLQTRPDDAVDHGGYRMADYYVAFRVVNPNAKPIRATVTCREREYPETGRTIAVRGTCQGATPRFEQWQPLDAGAIEILADQSACRLSLTVPPESFLDVASMYWMSATEVYEEVDALNDRNPGAFRLRSLGETALGLRIPLIDLAPLSSPDAPLCIVSATPQCHECGTIATMGILHAAVDGRLDGVLKRWSLRLLPLTNPDGNALGNCMTNSLRQNVIFGFGRVGSADAPAECEAVWRYLAEARPQWLLEFHSYPHLNRPSFRPYDFDLSLFPDEGSRGRGRTFFDAVRGVSPNPPVRLEAGSAIERQFRPSLVSRTIRDLGIPATLYKLHNRETIAGNVAHALDVLSTVARAMET